MTTKPRRRQTQARKPKTFGRNALAVGAAAIGLGGAVLALWLRAKRNPAEHAAPDLALDQPRPGAGDRAPEAFRPDPTAVPSRAERESLRPATGPSPSMVVDRGTLSGQGPA